MDLFEFEGKALFRAHDIPVAASALICSPDAPAPLPFPFVLKAQVMTGGRGKAGGVKVCRDEDEYSINRNNILGMSIKGHKVHGLLAEELLTAGCEYYISITQTGVTTPTLIFSAKGGMDIEAVARDNPEDIVKLPIYPFTGLKAYQCNYIADRMAVDKAESRAFLQKLTSLYFEEHATLVEINPLGIVDGRLVAMDSKLVIDDHSKAAAERRQAIAAGRDELYNYAKSEKEKTTVTYVPLDGDVGMISDGAGTGMMTLDLLTDMGARVACFTELGGMTSEEVMYRAMELTLGNHPDLKGLLIVLIGGFNRMDNMARGIIRYLNEHSVRIPVYTRMCGTMEDIGLKLMEEAGLPTFYDLTDAAESLISAIKE